MLAHFDLFVVTMKAVPTPAHPKYWEDACGFLLFWLYAEDEDDAGARALQIARALPYEVAGDELKIGRKAHDCYRAFEEQARGIGFAILWARGPVGTDVDAFVANPDF